ncbi:hypothetical protein A6R68_20257 [Neotoma lepida]|uniref:Uncharacterized protein n=1 Tax=Neotoma lepida TaxID=56216 RepID=A0A1A6HTH9_NEOLE|nr:hypothetical protein A6R68_20257 [Neotoma lepida]
MREGFRASSQQARFHEVGFGVQTGGTLQPWGERIYGHAPFVTPSVPSSPFNCCTHHLSLIHI